LGISLPDAPLHAFNVAARGLPRATEAERLVVQRVGQDVFRKALLAYWGGRCPMTGITDEPLLRASHIVPWAECDTDEHRLDVHNGLLLSALWDAAFDAGLISFADDGTVLASTRLAPTSAAALGLDLSNTLTGLTAAHRTNMAWHRVRYGF
jgi:predicted restriction endonuclease